MTFFQKLSLTIKKLSLTSNDPLMLFRWDFIISELGLRIFILYDAGSELGLGRGHRKAFLHQGQKFRAGEEGKGRREVFSSF